MSTTQVSSDASENAGVKNVDMKLSGHHSGVGCRPHDGVLRWSRVAAGRHPARLWDCPVNAVRLKLLGPVRHESHIRRAGIRQNTF